MVSNLSPVVNQRNLCSCMSRYESLRTWLGVWQNLGSSYWNLVLHNVRFEVVQIARNSSKEAIILHIWGRWQKSAYNTQLYAPWEAVFGCLRLVRVPFTLPESTMLEPDIYKYRILKSWKAIKISSSRGWGTNVAGHRPQNIFRGGSWRIPEAALRDPHLCDCEWLKGTLICLLSAKKGYPSQSSTDQRAALWKELNP